MLNKPESAGAGPHERLHGAAQPSSRATVKSTTCYMCAGRCGIDVHVENGRIRYIEGNPAHPVNRGVICAKGAAGIMHHYARARLTAPLLRVGPRGKGEFKEIGWAEAFAIATEKLARVRESEPKRLAFFTGRDQSQSFTSWWAAQFGTPNWAAHGGFCSVNMAAGGLYSIGGSFWEFGEPDWERTKYLLLIGVAEDHDSNPIKIGLGRVKSRAGTKIVSINPVRTGYSAIADEWVGIRPGTDGLLIGALIRQLLEADRVDRAFLAQYTNAPWLVSRQPDGSDSGLFVRDATGEPLCLHDGRIVPRSAASQAACLAGEVTLADGGVAAPAFQFLLEEYFKDMYEPEAAARATGVAAEVIRRLAAELADAAFNQAIELEIPWEDTSGRRHAVTIGRPVSIHAMRGVSAHSNGFDTCRMIHVLQMLLGAVDSPGAFRYKPPYPKSIPPQRKPALAVEGPGRELKTEPLGFPRGPEDLAIDADGTPLRIDKAFSWDHPLAVHGVMHMLLRNAWARDPYPIDVLFLYMANMAWNSSMNVEQAIRYLTDTDPKTGDYRIPFVIYSDAFYSETVAYADLVLPDTTYLERWDCISLFDRPIGSADAAADSIRRPVLEPDRNVRPFQDVLLELGVRLGLPGMVKQDGRPAYPGGYADYIVNHERAPGLGPLAGWRGASGTDSGRGAPNPRQLDAYIENGCFWQMTLPEDERYYRFANEKYLRRAEAMGWVADATPITLEIYSEILQKFRLAAEGKITPSAPESHRERLLDAFHAVPTYRKPLEHLGADPASYPLSAITQRPMHMYHSWGSQNAWLRQITSRNYLYISVELARQLALADDDWAWLESPKNRVRVQVKIMEGVEPGTVWTWNAVGKREGAWGLEHGAPEFRHGFLLNHVLSEFVSGTAAAPQLNSDPVTGQAAWYDAKVRIRKSTNVRDTTSPFFPAVRHRPWPPRPAPTSRPSPGALSFRALTDGLHGSTEDYVAWQVRDDDA